MSKLKTSLNALLLASIIGIAPSAHAADPGFYFGGGLGQGDDKVLDQTSAAAKLFVGFNMNPFLGLEFAYVNLGSNYVDIYGRDFTQDGGSFDLVGYLPLSPFVDLYARGGIYNWTVSTNTYYSYGARSGTSNDYGFGISTEVSPRLRLRGEYQKFLDVAGGDVNLVSVSLAYHF